MKPCIYSRNKIDCANRVIKVLIMNKGAMFLYMLICLSSSINAQDDMPTALVEPISNIGLNNVQELIYSNFHEVFVIKKNNYGLLIDSKGHSLYKGVIDIKTYKSLHLPYIVQNTLYRLNKQEITLSNKFVERASYDYLTGNDSLLYCIVMDSIYKETTPNGHIATILEDGDVGLFAFTCGETRGLCCSRAKLWYLYKSQNTNDSGGFIREYNLESRNRVKTFKINVADPVGLVFANNALYTYSNNDNTLYKVNLLQND